MGNPFRKGQPQKSKEQKQKEKRINQFVQDVLHPFLVANCKSVYEMKRRVECVNQAIELNLAVRVGQFKSELEKSVFKEHGVKPLPGKGEDLEAQIIDILADLPLKEANEITALFPAFIDGQINIEMMERKPDSLKVRITQ